MADDPMNFYKDKLESDGDYGMTVVNFFETCSEKEYGPFDVVNFPIGPLIKKMEDYYGNHNKVSLEHCEEPAKLFALALIGNTKEALNHLFHQCTVMTRDLVIFTRHVFKHLSAVSNYNANFAKVKGSLILYAFCDLIEESAAFAPTLQNIAVLLSKFTVPRRSSQLAIIPCKQLFDAILIRLLKREMIDFWTKVFADFLRGLKRSNIRLEWSFEADTMLNPINLCVLLLEILGNSESLTFDYEDVFKSLGDLLSAQKFIFPETVAFRAAPQLDWATKSSILDYLQVPLESYRRALPRPIYHVLSDKAKKDYVSIDDSSPTFSNYLVSIFELSLISSSIPNEFLENGMQYSQNYEVINFVACCFYEAFKYVANVRPSIEIKESTLEDLEKVLDMFDCEISLGLAKCTKATFEVVSKMQSALLIGKAAKAGLISYRMASKLQEPIVDYRKTEEALQKLILTFCSLANKIYRPYKDELCSSLDDEFSKIPLSKLKIMSAVYCLLQEAAFNIFAEISSPPDELKLMMDYLDFFKNDYVKYAERIGVAISPELKKICCRTMD